MTRLAIMQPYFLPYLGYWQLMAACHKFIIYDDVNYIKGGWVNRNRILVNGAPAYITAPLQQASPYRRICDIQLQPGPYWREKMVKTILQAYRKAPCFDEVFPILRDLISHPEKKLSDYLAHQLETLAAWMNLPVQFALASRAHPRQDTSSQDRVIEICAKEHASCYINAPGGMALYDPSAFAQIGTALRFMVMRPEPYPQRGSGNFLPYMSIVDALMAVGRRGIGRLLDAYDIVAPSQ